MVGFEKSASAVNNVPGVAVSMLGSYQMCPSLAESFKTNKVKEIIRKTLGSMLQGKTYNVDDAMNWSKDISEAVSAALRDVHMAKYKHVVQVTIGQQLGAGCKYIAKCFWDAECDNYHSDVFSNSSLYCICTVFGIYRY